MIDVIYLKESFYNTKNEFTKEIKLYLERGYKIESFNTYGSGGNSSSGYSVILLTKDAERVSI